MSATVDQPLLHPSNIACDGRCDRDPAEDIVHREPAQTVATPFHDPTLPVTLALVQSDEIDPSGRQVAHPSETVLALGAVSVTLTGEETTILLAALARVEQRQRLGGAMTPCASGAVHGVMWPTGPVNAA